MSTGQLVFYGGAALLAVTILLAVVFLIRKPVYTPEKAVYDGAAQNRTQPFRSGYPTDPLTVRRDTPEKKAEETLPLAEETVPLTQETPPLRDETVPLAAEAVLPVQETMPLTEETVPLTEETVPLTEETVPLTEETVPLSADTAPLSEETVPLAAACSGQQEAPEE